MGCDSGGSSARCIVGTLISPDRDAGSHVPHHVYITSYMSMNFLQLNKTQVAS